MLRFRRIRVKNWVVYEDVELDLSTDPLRNLTVIRAQNGVGKTVLLRAMRWALYGDETFEELDDDEGPYQVKPVWVEAGEIETKVEIEFETDLVDRDEEDTTGARVETYILERRLETRGPNKRELKRGPSSLTLFKHDVTGELLQQDDPKRLIERMLPPSLRDLFVMDADKAEEFTGGADGRWVDPLTVEKRTTRAITSLLGLELVEDATKRLVDLATKFRRDATTAIDDQEITRKQEELNDLNKQIDEAKKKLADGEEKHFQTTEKIARTEQDLERELKDSGSYEELEKRNSANKRQLAHLKKDRERLRKSLAGLLEDMSLLTALCRTDIEEVSKALEPLYQEGAIPQRHLSYVKKLLGSGKCVCGQDLKHPGPHRASVEKSVEDAEGNESGADFLGNAWEVTRSFEDGVTEGWPNWGNEKEALTQELNSVERDLFEEQDNKKEIDRLLDNIDEDRIKILKRNRDNLKTHLDTASKVIARNEELLRGLEPRAGTLTRELAQKQGNRREADDHIKSGRLADIIHEILEHSYGVIREEQVGELSKHMDNIFHQIVHNRTREGVEGAEEENTRGLQNINIVGVRPMEGRTQSFEIYAADHQGIRMSMKAFNGASRRVVALSFVLALCEESDTQAPVVADSLLNSMSGSVAANTTRLAAQHSSQAILLLTPKDLGEGLAEKLSTDGDGRMGASYTLTNMDQVGTEWGDVVRKQDGKDRRTLICNCSPIEYCEICERNGTPDTWTYKG